MIGSRHVLHVAWRWFSRACLSFLVADAVSTLAMLRALGLQETRAYAEEAAVLRRYEALLLDT